MKIFRNDYNTPQMQIEENKKNIELLASIIKEAYRSDLQLLTTDVSIAISDTNANADTTDGWLIDPIGKIFKITGGDGTNLLIEFYSDLRGATGATGADGAQGDRGFSTRYCSQQISGTILVSNTNIYPNIDIQVNDIILDDYSNIGIVTDISGTDVEISYQASFNIDLSSAKDKGTYFTTTHPTYDSGTGYYTLDEGHFENQNIKIPIKAFDLLIYINNGDVKEIYKVLNKVGTNWTVDKIGDVGGGKQLYEHNITIHWNNNMYLLIRIINDNNTAFAIQTLIDWLYNNNYRTENKAYGVSGYSTYTGYDGTYPSIFANTNARIDLVLMRPDGTKSGDALPPNATFNSFNDVIRAL